ncbi:hypothetical protein ACM9XA_03605 [Xanthomonas sacchari]
MTAPVAVDVLNALQLIAEGEGDIEVLAMRVHSVILELLAASEEWMEAEDQCRPSSRRYYDTRTRWHAALARAGVGGSR